MRNEKPNRRRRVTPFDPSKGNNRMSFREWADTHTGKNKKKRWKTSQTRTKGLEWQAAANARAGETGIDSKGQFSDAWKNVSQEDVSKQRAKNRKAIPKGSPKPRGFRQREPEGGRKEGPPGPTTNTIGPKASPGTYKDFVKQHGGKSTDVLGARYRKSKGLALNDKMKAALKRNAQNAQKRRGKEYSK